MRSWSAAVAALVLCLTACSSTGEGRPDRAAEAPSGSASASPTTPSNSPSGASPSASTANAADDSDAEVRRRAQRIVGRLSLRELAGQVIVADYSGTRPPTRLVRDLHLGGVIVMGHNVTGTAQLRRSNQRLRAATKRSGRDWPLFIGVDQEGGIVERVKGRATRFPTFMSAGAADDTRLTRRAAAASGAELRHLGFTAVFAPVADVTAGASDPTIGSRAAGGRPRLVARQAMASVEGYQRAGVLPVVKHFPGHGSVSADSHVALPVQRRSLRRLGKVDLVPFRAAVNQDAPAVMTGHLDVRAVDPRTPATVSRPVVHGLLRKDLGYDGLVFTDAMNMAAVADRYSSGEAAVRSLLAGNDVVLMPPDPRAARDAIARAVREGRLSRERLTEAATRQVATLLDLSESRSARPRPLGSARGASYQLSAGAVTVVSGRCQGRLVGRAVQATGSSSAVARFNDAARRAGLQVGRGTSVALIGYGGSGSNADVVVTTDTPYALGSSSARVARIALYGDTPGAMRALVDVLLGNARATGKLPVPVPGVPRRGC